MPVNHPSAGQMVIRRGVAPPAATPPPEAPVGGDARAADTLDIPTGEFRVHCPNPVTSLAHAGEPVWWWLPLLVPRTGLMFLLWATRSPQNALIAAAALGALALVTLMAGG